MTKVGHAEGMFLYNYTWGLVDACTGEQHVGKERDLHSRKGEPFARLMDDLRKRCVPERGSADEAGSTQRLACMAW